MRYQQSESKRIKIMEYYNEFLNLTKGGKVLVSLNTPLIVKNNIDPMTLTAKLENGSLVINSLLSYPQPNLNKGDQVEVYHFKEKIPTDLNAKPKLIKTLTL